MKKDIDFPKVEDIGMAVVREDSDKPEKAWSVYLINLKKNDIDNVLVASKGYGERDGEKVKTSTLRHFFDSIPAQSFAKIEPIMEELFSLGNEYWVSFYQDTVIFDRKYVFVPGSISPENFVTIPLLKKQGILIK